MSESYSYDASLQAGEISARLERLPASSWHRKMRAIIGSAWLFDAFDALAIAFVLPVLIPTWSLSPGEVGGIISIGFTGQLLGSLAAGWMADKWGRVPVASLTTLIFAVGSLMCSLAWNYQSLLMLRLVQGLGLGGEIPVMLAYVNEFAKAESRGRFSLAPQVFFAVGLFGVAIIGTWVVPVLGWRCMFLIGAIPALLVVPLRLVLPESPRWLVSRGRFQEARDALARIESVATAEGKVLPQVSPQTSAIPTGQTVGLTDLFRRGYAKRTTALSLLGMCTSLIAYSLTSWAPSLFHTVYHLGTRQALGSGLMLNGVGLLGAVACIILIDRIGRKRLFVAGLVLGAVPLSLFALHSYHKPASVLALLCLSFVFITQPAFGLGVYAAENYPNNMRALGLGFVSAWQRVATIVGPLFVGMILPVWGINAVFCCFSLVGVCGATACAVWGTETRGLRLEDAATVM